MEEGANSLGGAIFQGSDVINPASDKDFFLINLTEGEWYQIFTDANPDDNTDMVDTVVRVYDSGGTMVASVDDAFPRLTTDSELFYRAPATGEYCIEVLEFSDWYGNSPEGQATFSYDLRVLPLDFGLYEQVNLDSEDGGTAMSNDSDAAAESGLSVFTTTSGQVFTQMAGMLDPGTDVDWWEFTTPAATIGFSMDLTPAGPGGNQVSGFGSTEGPGLVGLYDTTGQLLAEVDNAQQANGLDGMSSVPLSASTTYRVKVDRQTATLGTNDFYFLKVFTQDTLNPQEGGNGQTPSDNGTNDTKGGAETGQSQLNDDGSYSTFIGGTIPEGDVDWWTFDTAGMPAAGQNLVVACSSWAAGSGVRGFTVSYTDDGGQSTHADGIETQATGVLWSDTAPTATAAGIQINGSGPHFIKLENVAGTADHTASATHYLCGLHNILP